jgi:hypothetical protein
MTAVVRGRESRDDEVFHAIRCYGERVWERIVRCWRFC